MLEALQPPWVGVHSIDKSVTMITTPLLPVATPSSWVGLVMFPSCTVLATLTTSCRIHATAVARCSILSLSSMDVCKESTESWPLSSSGESPWDFSVVEESDIFLLSDKCLNRRSFSQLSYKCTAISESCIGESLQQFQHSRQLMTLTLLAEEWVECRD